MRFLVYSGFTMGHCKCTMTHCNFTVALLQHFIKSIFLQWIVQWVIVKFNKDYNDALKIYSGFTVHAL